MENENMSNVKESAPVTGISPIVDAKAGRQTDDPPSADDGKTKKTLVYSHGKVIFPFQHTKVHSNTWKASEHVTLEKRE